MGEIPQDSLPEKTGFSKDVPVEADIDLQRQDGSQVKISDLKGKVSVVSHVFTRCPRQCPGICALVNEVREEFSDNPAFMVASLTMDPAYDTPEILAKFAKTHGYEADNWWFLTGAPDELPGFMEKQFLFAQQDIPEDKRQVPNDLYEHDSNVALLDHNLRIRGWYSAVDETDMAKLRKDIQRALDAVPAK
jgi:protein SCO1/2